jgi:hypothetical protein
MARPRKWKNKEDDDLEDLSFLKDEDTGPSAKIITCKCKAKVSTDGYCQKCGRYGGMDYSRSSQGYASDRMEWCRQNGFFGED